MEFVNYGQARSEICWETGIYDNDCICEFCEHKHECSGYIGDEEDEEE